MKTRLETSSQPTATGLFNAWFFDRFDGLIDRYLRPLKDGIFSDLPDTIVEIGPGVGANFRYYDPGTRVIAFEPNRAMHQRLRNNAERHGIELELHSERAEGTGLPEASYEAVVSTMVLCTVGDPAGVVTEAWRVLEEGGRLIFVEHVRATGRFLRAIQRLIARPWETVFEGCRLDRDTLETISSSGFRRVKAKERLLTSPFLPVNVVVAGVAHK